MLIRLERRIIELTFDEEPVTRAGRLFVPRSGKAFLERIVPTVWRAGRWEPYPNLRVPSLGGMRLAAGDITASGAFYPTWRDKWDTTQLAIDLDLDTHKVAIFGSATTPNFSTDTAYAVAPYDTDEKSGGSWPAGGYTLVGTAVTESPAGSMMWDATDVSQATSTFTGGEGCLTYADVLGTNNAICLHDFTTTASPNAGTMEIQWAATGLTATDLTP